MDSKCTVSHQKTRFLRKPIASFDHKWGDEFRKYVFANTGEYLNGVPIQRKDLRTYRKCEKCERIECLGVWDWYEVAPRIDVEWRENNLN
jgi:hypothetical protein